MNEGGTLVSEIEDERTPLALRALGLIEELFPPVDRQPLAEIAMEIAEKRLDVRPASDFHMFVAHTPEGEATAVVVGVYLRGVNAGFVSYLAVRPEFRTRELGRRLRTRLVGAFGDDARRAGRPELAWVVGEVRRKSPWLRRLVRERGAVPFNLEYFHPGISPATADARWVLYRQPVADRREEMSATEVRRVLYAVWRRVYRVRYPLEHPGFAAMFAELDGRRRIGADPEVLEAAG